MQRNPLIIAYHTALLFYATIEDISTFVFGLSVLVELIFYTLIVLVFSLKSFSDFAGSLLFVVFSVFMLIVVSSVFLGIADNIDEDPFQIFNQTIFPICIGLLATHSLTVYKIIKENVTLDELRIKLGNHYLVIYGFAFLVPIALAAVPLSYAFVTMVCLAIVRLMAEYDFFRKIITEPEMKPGLRGFIKLSPSQQANRLLRQLRREKRRKNSQ